MKKTISNSVAAFLCAALVPTSVLAAKGDMSSGISNGPAGMERAAPPMPSVANSNNHGHFVCTAAINANGTVFSGEYVNASLTTHLATGTYQVGFAGPCPDVRIANGWFRIAQPDTLTYNTLPSRTCTVADRYGIAAAIWVQCYDNTGALVDTPFTLHLSR